MKRYKEPTISIFHKQTSNNSREQQNSNRFPQLEYNIGISH